MSSIISSYIFEPVVRQARRFSNAPPGSNDAKPAPHHDATQTIITAQGRAHSHANDHFARCVNHSAQCSSDISDAAGLNDSATAGELQSSEPGDAHSPAPAQTTPYAIAFGQALFDRFVPRLISRPSNIGNSSPLCSPSVEHESTDDERHVHQLPVDQPSASSVTLPLAERERPQHSLDLAQRTSGSESEGISNSLLAASSLPMPTSPLRSGYRPFRRSTADARSLSRDLEALERAARSLGRARGPLPPQRIPEDDGQQTLRQRIQAIWSLDIATEEKARMMHAVMNEAYYSMQPRARPRSSDGFEVGADGVKIPTESESPSPFEPPFDPANPFNLYDSDYTLTLRPVPTNQSSNETSPAMDDEEPAIPDLDLGCIHYKRNVKIQCFECKTWWPCRLCHDDANLGHQLPRHKTQYMLCMLCSKPSEASQHCRHCSVRSSYYYCDICKLWDDDSTKRIYHCTDCGICRIGEGIGKDYYHCKKCNVCIPIQHESTHKCIERATECDCPICGAYMFNSSAAINAMPCGHYMHQKCYNDFISRAYRCPICQKSVVNMELQWRKLDDAISSQPMPAKLRDKVVEVRCNDCHGKSLCRYHWLGNRCGLCDSYNTLHVKFIKPGDQEEDVAEGDAASSSQMFSVGQRSPSLVPQRAQRYFQDDQEVAAVAEALAAAQQNPNNQSGGALDSALALPGHAYRILADMSRNLEPLRQYLSQMHPSMLEEVERLGLVNGEGATADSELQAGGFWSSGDEDEDDDEEEVNSEVSELGRDELDLEADEEDDGDDEDEDEDEEEEESDWDDEEDDDNQLDIFLIGHM